MHNSTDTITLEFYDPETEESTEATIEVSFSVEPVEYDGPFVFYAGGVNLENYSVESFVFKGTTYTTLDPMLLPYAYLGFVSVKSANYSQEAISDVLLDPTIPYLDKVDAIADANHLYKQYVQDTFEESIASAVKVPVHKYPDSRKY
jgi:hypothetical protein